MDPVRLYIHIHCFWITMVQLMFSRVNRDFDTFWKKIKSQQEYYFFVVHVQNLPTLDSPEFPKMYRFLCFIVFFIFFRRKNEFFKNFRFFSHLSIIYNDQGPNKFLPIKIFTRVVNIYQ